MGRPRVLRLTSCQAENSEFIGRAAWPGWPPRRISSKCLPCPGEGASGTSRGAQGRLDADPLARAGCIVAR